ncbi:MAG: hypothetical protein LC798_13080 [Chloroflexi bacterium]|nr:hypothetical protein [Chloroflexota bacterium]
MPTLEMNLHVRHVSEEEAKRVKDAVVDAVYRIVPHGPSTTSSVLPDYDGPGRTEEEQRRAAAEGRR